MTDAEQEWQAGVSDATRAYMNCALWVFGDTTPVLDTAQGLTMRSMTQADLLPEARGRMRADVAKFLRLADPHIALWPEGEQVSWSMLGHHLWFTRNGLDDHDVLGFTNRGWGGLGDVMAQIAKDMGPCVLVWDDEMKALRIQK